MSVVRKRLARWLLAALGAALLAGSLVAAPASADDYDPHRAGHPLRILAYIVHPVGVALDYLVMRPAHWVGSHQPWRTIFGHQMTLQEEVEHEREHARAEPSPYQVPRAPEDRAVPPSKRFDPSF